MKKQNVLKILPVSKRKKSTAKFNTNLMKSNSVRFTNEWAFAVMINKERTKTIRCSVKKIMS